MNQPWHVSLGAGNARKGGDYFHDSSWFDLFFVKNGEPGPTNTPPAYITMGIGVARGQ